jgi:hypothetical protein
MVSAVQYGWPGGGNPKRASFSLLPPADLAAAGHRAAACPTLLVHRLAASARTARLLNQADSAVATVSGRVSRRTRRRQGDGPPAGRIVPLSTRPSARPRTRRACPGSKTSSRDPAHSRSSQLIKPWPALAVARSMAGIADCVATPAMTPSMWWPRAGTVADGKDRSGQPRLAGDRCPDRGKDIEVLVHAWR